MATPAKVLVPFSPAEVDALAQEYQELETKIADIQLEAKEKIKEPAARLEELDELFLMGLRNFGSAHAAKSKMLHGNSFEVMGTFGMSSSTDWAAVNNFRLALVKAKLTRLLKRIFDRTERWDLRPNAGEIIRSVELPPKLLALYAQCQVTHATTPRLTVRPKA